MTCKGKRKGPMRKVIVIGAGINGVSAAIWLRRMGADVTLVDKGLPGQGASFGNAGVLAASAVVPLTTPGLMTKAPGMLLDSDFPLFMRWGYLPRMVPWLLRYAAHANDRDTRRIAAALLPVIGDTLDQHLALTEGLPSRRFIAPSDYTFAYASRAAFQADRYTWDLRRSAGFEPKLLEGDALRAYEPTLGSAIRCLGVLGGHGHILDPGGYVAALAADFAAMGGTVMQTEVQDVTLEAGQITEVLTSQGTLPCDAAVLSAGVWSGPLARRLGLRVPMESERGYHLMLRGVSGGPKVPVMVESGKFVATPMAEGLRLAGIVEFGGLRASASRAPLELLRRQARRAFPGLTWQSEEPWMGHRPAPSDSLPLVGEIGKTGVFTAFGHHHIGLTGGPKTGRWVAGLIAGQPTNADLAPYDPNRFRR
nr:FAD-binding oxidoreductase [Tropicibacter naphthalenivorans]